MKIDKHDQILIDDAAFFFDKPLEWAAYAFDWDSDPSIQIVKVSDKYKKRWRCEYGLDDWALQVLDEWGEAIKKNKFDGRSAVPPFKLAISSGHGIGKSCLTSIIILFIMSTRPFCKGTVTAGKADQLKTKTWSELGKWLNRCITGSWFDYNNSKGNMNLFHRAYKESWRCDGFTSREENSESFAGQHAVNSSSFYIFDEASQISDKIWEVAEGGMTDGEPFWFVYGNPTRTNGMFRECFRKFAHRWIHRKIDSRSVKITNKEMISEWVKDHGENSDFIKVRVRGEFPSQSVKQFFPETLTAPARGRQIERHKYEFAPKIITCDPAWEGDDELVISMRQGLAFKILKTIPKNDNDILIAQILAQYEDDEKADAVFIDGGFGTGIISAGRTMNRSWTILWFNAASPKPGFLNLRAYMANEVKQWLKEGGCLPDDDGLYSDFENLDIVPRTDGIIQLEAKKDIKSKGFPSPNKLDTLMMSFACNVRKKERDIVGSNNTSQYMCELPDD